jgi:enoyl-CoA hydratase/carnithine racemase
MSGAISVADLGAPAVRLTLDAPGGNRLAIGDVRELAAALEEAAERPETRAIVLTGAGDDFCLGRDAQRDGPLSPQNLGDRVAGPILALYAAIRDVDVPVLAAVRGRAAGLGCALAGSCDVTLASDGARFSLPELRGGLPPTLAISALAGPVSHQALARLVLEGCEIDVREARAIGLIAAHVADDALEAAMTDLVAGPASASRASIAAVKRYLTQVRFTAPADTAVQLLEAAIAARDEEPAPLHGAQAGPGTTK